MLKQTRYNRQQRLIKIADSSFNNFLIHQNQTKTNQEHKNTKL